MTPGLVDHARADWDRGLHMGWEGPAWAWLQAVEAGLTRADGGMDGLRRRALLSLRRPPSPFCGQWVGDAAAALVTRRAARLDRALEPVARASQRRWEQACRRSPLTDYMGGRAGALCAAAELEAGAPGRLPPRLPRLLHESVARRLTILLEIREEAPVYLGLSHGIAGLLLALECSRAVFSLPLAPALRERTLEVLERSRLSQFKRFAVWPDLSERGRTASSWCHGAPGIALALGAAWKLNGRAPFLKLAEAGWRSAFAVPNAERNFCCGSVGRAQILLEAHRLTGRAAFLEQARAASRDRGIRSPGRYREEGLGRGLMGLSYLEARLERPGILPLPGLGPLSLQRESPKPSSAKARA